MTKRHVFRIALDNGERREIPARRMGHTINGTRYFFALHRPANPMPLRDKGRTILSHWDSGLKFGEITPSIRTYLGEPCDDVKVARWLIDQTVHEKGLTRVENALSNPRPAGVQDEVFR